MSDFWGDSLFFALAVSLTGYELGLFLRRKTGLALFNPLLIAILMTMAVLVLFHIDYETYEEGGRVLSYFLTPATVALAVPLYRQAGVLRKHGVAIGIGVLSGVLTSLFSTLLLAVLFGLSHTEYVTLLPKSITTAIGMGVSAELGGTVTITVAVIIVTGIVGNMTGSWICRLFRIREPLAKGLAFGTAAHAVGTARALELGELEGAMSGLSIVLAGVFTVAGANVFAAFF